MDVSIENSVSEILEYLFSDQIQAYDEGVPYILNKFR